MLRESLSLVSEEGEPPVSGEGEPDGVFEKIEPELSQAEKVEPEMATDSGEPEQATDSGEPELATDSGEPELVTDSGEPEQATDSGELDRVTDSGERLPTYDESGARLVNEPIESLPPYEEGESHGASAWVESLPANEKGESLPAYEEEGSPPPSYEESEELRAKTVGESSAWLSKDADIPLIAALQSRPKGEKALANELSSNVLKSDRHGQLETVLNDPRFQALPLTKKGREALKTQKLYGKDGKLLITNGATSFYDPISNTIGVGLEGTFGRTARLAQKRMIHEQTHRWYYKTGKTADPLQYKLDCWARRILHDGGGKAARSGAHAQSGVPDPFTGGDGTPRSSTRMLDCDFSPMARSGPTPGPSTPCLASGDPRGPALQARVRRVGFGRPSISALRVDLHGSVPLGGGRPARRRAGDDPLVFL